ncbi:hypothetical protein HQ560_11515, partial [bacterium]|nr:hypothetical protein [bacterium]
MRSVLFVVALAALARSGESPYAKWSHGPKVGFPIAVWLQDTRLAPRYKAAGINLYIGLWKGPTEKQLADLTKAGMPVICDQNAVGLAHKDDAIIVGWMHGDEPDNAQSLGKGKGYGPPVLPAKIVADYKKIAAADPTRPVILNLGQGVAWDNWVGRGTRTRHPEDYAEYVKGCDVVSFDIYPVASARKEVHGNLWYVPYGVERLKKWAAPRPVWNCIECTYIQATTKATPHQVRAEVWMSLIHGSRGLIYFVHEWKPKFNAKALLDDAEMLKAVTAINKQVQALAPVLDAEALEVAVTSTVPVAAIARKHEGATYVFAVGMKKGATRAVFQIAGLAGQAEVIGEGRTVPVRDGRIEDDFAEWDAHLY